MRELHALIEGQEFDTADDLEARLAELIRRGSVYGKARALKQDNRKWRAQELAYDAMDAEDPFEAAQLAIEALDLDPDCTDAQRVLVWLAPTGLDNRIQLMREVVEKAERNLGEEFMEENRGHFWGLLSTRPYMRAMRDLAELLLEADRLDEAIAVYERMLDLNPNDNQGVRYALLGLYLGTGRADRAAELFDRYPGEEDYSAAFAWGRVMLDWLAGREAAARLALINARRVNPFAERYLTGEEPIPERLPPAYTPGQPSEAQVAAGELRPACKALPEFRAWLGQQK